MTESERGAPSVEHPRGGIGHVTRIVVVVLLLAVLAAVALDNRQNVRVGWVIGDGDTPLALVVGLAAVAGAIIGWLVLHWPRRRSARSSR